MVQVGRLGSATTAKIRIGETAQPLLSAKDVPSPDSVRPRRAHHGTSAPRANGSEATGPLVWAILWDAGRYVLQIVGDGGSAQGLEATTQRDRRVVGSGHPVRSTLGIPGCTVVQASKVVLVGLLTFITATALVVFVVVPPLSILVLPQRSRTTSRTTSWPTATRLLPPRQRRTRWSQRCRCCLPST